MVGAGPAALGRGKARALPHPIDDLSIDYGTDIYEEMLLDPQVAANVAILKASILEDGVNLAPAIEDQDDDRYELAVQIRDVARRMFARMTTPLDDVLWNMLDATWAGNKVAEQVFELQRVEVGSADSPEKKELLQLKALKPKPRQAVVFVVDAFMNVLGFLGAVPGTLTPPAIGAVLEPNSPQILPRDKFAVLSWHPVDGDPRGTSVLRPAYKPWWRKQQLEPEYLRYLTQFASPSVWATPPPDEEGVSDEPTDSIGNPVDANGNPVDSDDVDGLPDEELSKYDELLALLLALKNSSAMVVPPGTEVHFVELQGDGLPFIRSFDQCDAQITKAILTQSLATEEGQHQSRAASQVHQDVLDTLVRQGKRALVRMLSEDILRPWVARNFGDDAGESLVPIPTLGTTESQDQPTLMTAVAGLMRANYFHPSQLPHVDELLGLPVRDLTQAAETLAASGPAPGEPSAPAGGQAEGEGTPEPGGTPSPPSGPARRGGRGPKAPARRVAPTRPRRVA
jgi:hypothetical protein